MNGDVIKVMILAAGEGSRLRPLTLHIPKVLLPIGGIPLIQYTLSWLKSHGVSEIAINLHHLGGKIEDFLGDGSCFGMSIRYSPENELLGTASGVKRMEKFFDSTFLVVYGDVLTDFNLSAMINFHRQKKALGTLALLQTSHPWASGIVEMDKKGRLVGFKEKPPRGSGSGNLLNGGVYVLDKEILNHIPVQGFCDFGHDVLPQLMKLGLPVYGYVLKPEDYLIDIGTWDKYHQANKDIRYGSLPKRPRRQLKLQRCAFS